MKSLFLITGLVIGASFAIYNESSSKSGEHENAVWVEKGREAATRQAGFPAASDNSFFSRKGGVPAACGVLYGADKDERYIFISQDIEVIFERRIHDFPALWKNLCKD